MVMAFSVRNRTEAECVLSKIEEVCSNYIDENGTLDVADFKSILRCMIHEDRVEDTYSGWNANNRLEVVDSYIRPVGGRCEVRIAISEPVPIEAMN